MDQLTETWEINNRLNLYLLGGIAEAHLADTLSSRGRNVGQQFAHIHNVRLMWLKVALPAALEKPEKIEKDAVTKKDLEQALQKSGEAISLLLAEGVKTGKIKGFKPHPTAFLGYLLAHEAHHRSQLILALKQSGHPVDKKIAYGLWEWGNK